MKKILVINVNWLGDVIFSTPVFKALRKRFPESHISCLAVPRVRAILDACPGIDEIIEYDEKGHHQGFVGKIKMISFLRSQHFDIAFLLHRSWTRAFLIFAAGIPLRVGFNSKKRGGMLTHPVRPPVDAAFTHRSDYYCQILESYGIPVEDRTCELNVPQESRRRVKELLDQFKVSDEDFVILVNMGGNWDLKRWPEKNFRDLIERLADASFPKNIKIVIPGAQKDVALVNRAVNDIDPNIFIALAGKTELSDLIALMSRADLVISADSGPLHIASCVGRRAIGLFGPTRPEVTGPRGRGEVSILHNDVGCNRAPCYFLDCPDNICMQSIRVDDVLQTAQEMMLSALSH